MGISFHCLNWLDVTWEEGDEEKGCKGVLERWVRELSQEQSLHSHHKGLSHVVRLAHGLSGTGSTTLAALSGTYCLHPQLQQSRMSRPLTDSAGATGTAG